MFAVDKDEIPIDVTVMKKYQQADATSKTIILRLERNKAGPDYSLRPALGFVLLHHQKRVVVPEALVKLSSEKQYHLMSTFWWPGMEGSRGEAREIMCGAQEG
ncbi:hypothetical protein PHMEG_00013420 [Phytophthora megakarya]|uniref:Uncharacterized protein n=1 Tax=Phytophthora megakarya TaxID=4795 RepID=A0A225W6R5_9STRA|nr:hypothetical protein PHMEG_00013420 [Phytophthora megakarya]